MARMMGSVILHREYCQYGCCTKLPLWNIKGRGVAHRIQRSREKRAWKKEAGL